MAFFVLSFALGGHCVLAQGAANPQATNYGLTYAAGFGLPTLNLVTFILRLVQVALGLLGVIAVLLIIYAGFVWMTAAGDPAKVDKAKKIIYNVIIGLIIIFLAFAIVTFVINALSGVSLGPPAGGPVIPGGSGDISRSAIGAGPIESVYPAPYQKDVPISTWIAVTFKMQMDSSTLMDLSHQKINGSYVLKNIEICQASATSGACLASSTFDVIDFASSTVSTTDFRTFVITPQDTTGNGKYLGINDNQLRTFKVAIKGDADHGNGVKSLDGRSVLQRYTLNGYGYKWMFETNGKLDLDPPKIISSGVMPAPDDYADIYSAGASPSSTVFAFNLTTTTLNLKRNATYTQPTTLGTVGATLSGTTYAGSHSGTVTVLISSSDKKATTYWHNPDISFTDNNYDYTKDSIINMSEGSGLTFTLNGPPDFNSSTEWNFTVTPKASGDRVEIYTYSSKIDTIYFEQGVIATTSEMIAAIVSQHPDIFTTSSCPTGDICTIGTGANGSKYDLRFFYADQAQPEAGKIAKNPGQSQTIGHVASGTEDVPRNQIFQINFNKAINPLVATSSYIQVWYSSGTSPYSLDTLISGTQISLSNQYRTVEILPPNDDKYKCGKNACGDDIYCWPVNSLIDTDRNGVVDADKINNYPDLATEYKVYLSAASLKKCTTHDESWCTAWGGTCLQNTRCHNQADSSVYFPTAPGMNGLMDMCGNSFNGNFSTTTYNDMIIGSSQGKSASAENSALGLSGTDADGGSGKDAYDLNLQAVSTSAGVIYPATTTYGDDLRWTFWVSDEVDLRSPLISAIYPLGDQTVENYSEPVSTTFDRAMRIATLIPGWNYGVEAKDKSQRYVVLSTLSNSANPVGYWISTLIVDDNGDGVADRNIAATFHDVLDRNIKYGPLYGSGIESLRQNCYLPGAGPKDALSYTCVYNADGTRSSACAAVDNINPASYASTTCAEIMMDNAGDRGAVECGLIANEVCKVLYYDPKDRTNLSPPSPTSTNKEGSWIITKDHPTSTNGVTGCCFGRCVDSSGNIINRK